MRINSHIAGLGIPICMHVVVGTFTEELGQVERYVLGLLPFLLALPEIPLRDLVLVALASALFNAEASLGQTLMLPAVAGSKPMPL